MAPKQKILPVPLDEPPTASSSSSASSSSEEQDQEHEASSEQVSSENEKEQNLSPPPKTLTQTEPEIESESESESETESESESDTIPAKVQPLPSKPKAQAQTQAQKPKAQPASTPSKSGSKRPTDSANGTESKRAKKKSSSASASDEKTKEDEKKEEEKKTPRRWSEDEELTILKCLLDLSSKTKQDPLKITNAAFHDFITKLPDWEEVSRDQLKVKLRGLKRKFDATVAKEKNGESLSFTKPHDQKVFELSKKVWGAKPLEVVEKPKSNGSVAKSPKKKEIGSGSSKNAVSAKKSKPESKKETKSQVLPVLNDSEKMDIDHKVDDDSVGLLSREFSRFREVVQLNEDEVKRGLVMIGESKRAELEQKWKELRSAEMKLFADRSLLIAEQTKLVVEALQSSDGYDSQ